MAEAGLSRIPDVDIDPDGVFKYVLIRVTPEGEGPGKEIVRGYAWAEYHGERGGAQPAEGARPFGEGAGLIEWAGTSSAAQREGGSRKRGGLSHARGERADPKTVRQSEVL